MILNKELFNFYKDKLDFPIITNSTKFSKASIHRFEHLMSRSKVYIDLSHRLTTGRAVYDAAFRGTFFVGTNTYGATDVLFPEYSLTTYPIDLETTLDRSLEALSNWNPQSVLEKRDYFRKHASVEGFLLELERRSK